MRTTRYVVLLLITVATPALTQEYEPVTSSLSWRNVGPTIMGGRVADLAVVESNPAIFYVGTATGGVWKTVNAGTTFEPVFDDQPTASVGDVTVAPSNPNIVWVGSGEPQNRQSSPWGMGVFKSTDAGRSWTHMGLTNTHHIARIQIHPRNPDVVYVAAVGHLWGSNPERGVYKTTDGGATWNLVLHIDEHTGAIDLVMDHHDPQTLFVAMYQRQRKAWGFNGGGPGSGIHRTTDGGVTWVKLGGGLPEGDLGRIGLDLYRRDGDLVFAIVEADKRAPGQGFGGGNEARKTGVYRSTDRGETWEHLSTTNNRPMYYSQIRIDPNDPERLYTGGSALFKSTDGGRTFTPDAARGVHLDHHALWIDPANSSHLILAGDGGVSISWDRSESWRQLTNLPVAQFYEIGVDLRDPYHVCGGLQDNGSWCAPSDTRSNQGIRTRDWYNIGSGDGFITLTLPHDTTVMFNESQGGNMTRVNLRTMERTRIRPVARPTEEDEDRSFRFNWNAPIIISAHHPNRVYLGGNVLFRSDDLGMTWEEISADLTRAIDRDQLEIMGVRGSEPQMSRNDGTSTYGNLTAVAESPLNADVLYTGSDDGVLHVTRDGGATWTDVTDNVRGLPERTYVTRIVASGGDEGTVVAAFDGHRNDDFSPYVYVSTNYGERWELIVDGLPEQWSVNALAQHPRTPNLWFVGNEIGVYFSTDGGNRWHALTAGLPTVPVDDIVIHPRDNDLVIGTHGRGIFIMADITPLEHLTPQLIASEAHLFPVREAMSYTPYTPQGWTPGAYVSPNPEYGALIRYYLRDDVSAPVATGLTDPAAAAGGPSAEAAPPRHDPVTIEIVDATGAVIRTLEGSGHAGVQTVVWDLRIEPPYEPENQEQGGGGGGFFGGGPRGPRVLPGPYTARLHAAGRTMTTALSVRYDPRATITTADLEARQEALLSAYRLAKPVYEAGRAVQRLTRQLNDIEQLVKDREDETPETLTGEIESFQTDLRGVGQRINRIGSASRSGNAIEASSTRPTSDQLWALERAWNEIPGLIDRLNGFITDRMPALNEQLNQHGIRPDAGPTIDVPRRGGR